jgi:hypothetical protein
MDMDKLFEKREGRLDRIARIVVGVALLVAYAWGVLAPPLGYLLLLLGIIALFTGLSGSCALYSLLGISTLEKAAGKRKR